ncbi:branched-chain amino acid ABC transporter permease, partial [Faecalibacterium sp. DFI.5.82]|uniref:branched-chain amino acid ABC transporter permease n=1 Tax=Faecalibacterium sp. DFI.5.82 TaxID=3031725 RepID=UPI0023AF7962
MWIDADAIIKAAALVTALGVLGGVVVSLYKASERDRKQSEIIKEILDEQSLICYGLQGAPQAIA